MLFVVSAFAVWRISSLLVREEGPFGIFYKLRHASGIRYNEYSELRANGVIAGILSCMWCCSVWVGFVVAISLSYDIASWLLHSFALSASAIFIDEILQRINRNGI